MEGYAGRNLSGHRRCSDTINHEVERQDSPPSLSGYCPGEDAAYISQPQTFPRLQL